LSTIIVVINKLLSWKQAEDFSKFTARVLFFFACLLLAS
jgi:hypothetical protein